MTSSFITAVTHDRTAKTLTIAMRGGKSYTYVDVPRSTFRGMLGSNSKGKFYNENVRNKYKGI